MPVSESAIREIVRDELSAVLGVCLGDVAPRQARASSRWRSWMPVFLRSLYEADGDVLKACTAVRPARSTIYAWRERRPRFARAWDRIVAMRRAASRPAWEALKAEILPASVLEWPDTAQHEESE